MLIVAGVFLALFTDARADAIPAKVSFLNDVEPILTRFGCNQGGCHGKGAGQNGFRLSLRGYAPEQDYDWITREFQGRRISATDPDSSPLLRKPSGQAIHEGGKLFDKSHRAYKTLKAWIAAGAPGPQATDPAIKTLTVSQPGKSLKPGQTLNLKVTASYADGSSRDVTWLTQFASNDAGMASVDAAGLVEVKRNGETAIRASYQGLVAVVIVTAPFDRPVPPAKLAAKNNFIDEHVMKKLGELRIEPSGLSSDSEFLRRVFLDTIGVLPTPKETREFLADRSADKRKKLIGKLLDRPEFIDHWTLFLSDLLQNRKERDHDVRGVKGVRSFHAWLRKKVKANTPWDVLAREVLTASGKSTDNPAVGYFIVTVGEHGQAERSEVPDSVAQAFLGTRIGCARCHNHPLERYTQDDFYHFAAYFSRLKLDRQDPKKGPTILRLLGTGGKEPHLTKSPVGVQQPRTNKFLAPRPLDRADLGKIEPGTDPRQALVKWMTDPRNEYFAGAMVNRLWKHFMGMGLVEPVDDLRASNPPTNPALWQALIKEFVSSKYDLKNMIRKIVESRTYQLTSGTLATNKTDTRFYSHYYARRLAAEVMLDAISSSTKVPDRFAGYPVGLRAGQLPDPGLKSYFLTLFGRSERVTACACERSGEVTMPQLLHLQNGLSVMEKIRLPEGRLGTLLKAKKTDDEITEELFLATLSRLPSSAQKVAVNKALSAGDKRDEVFKDLFWALVNSKEFAFNH